MPPEERNGDGSQCDTECPYPTSSTPPPQLEEVSDKGRDIEKRGNSEGIKEETEEGFEKEEDEEYDSSFESLPFFSIMSTYMGLGLFVIFGHLRDLLRRLGLDKTMSTLEYGNKVSN